MPADAKIGSSYLQVIPKMDAGDMDRELRSMEGPAGSAGEVVGQGFGNFFAKAAKALIAMGVTKAIADTTKAAVDAYSNYEQLAGGIMKIFDEINFDSIAADANRAYIEMGMSANQYMEAMVDVGATLAATMGDQRGYDAARRGLQAVSDYASGTGRSMDELTEKMTLIMRSTSSYQSIADQFSGILPATSAGFLEAAQAAGYLSDSYTSLTEVPIDEYQEAVSHMLKDGVDQLGLAGNTAAEAADTIAGSWAMLQSSWENLLVSIAGGGEDLSTAMQQVIDSLGTWLSNVVPVAATVVQNIFAAIPSAAGMAMDELKEKVEVGIAEAFGEDALAGVQTFADRILEALAPVGDMFAGLGDTVGGSMEGIADAFKPAADTFSEFFSGAGPAFDGMIERISGHVADMQEPLEKLGTAFSGLGENIGTIVSGAAPLLVEVLGNAASAVVWLADVLLELVAAAVNLADIITGALITAVEAIAPAFEGAVEFFAGIPDAISRAVQSAADAINGAFQGAADFVSGIPDTIVGFFTGLPGSISSAVSAIGDNLKAPFQTAWDFISGIPDKIVGIFSSFKIQLPSFTLPRIDWHMESIAGILDIPVFDGISWHARGGIVDEATLFGAGEAGPELIWPAYDPYMSQYAAAIAEHMPEAGNTTNVYVDGSLLDVDRRAQDALERFLGAIAVDMDK